MTVEYARKQTDDSPEGSEKRVEWLRQHRLECDDCRFANILKEKEMEVAQRIGPRAYAGFLLGEDTTKAPGYNADLMRTAMDELRAAGIVTPAFREWMTRASKRTKYKIPGH
jgi:hypothetical protein